MCDRTVKSKHPWAKFFVITPNIPNDDLRKSQIERQEQITILKQRKRSIKNSTIK
jgi:hypothetical protein